MEHQDLLEKLEYLFSDEELAQLERYIIAKNGFGDFFEKDETKITLKIGGKSVKISIGEE